MSNTQSAIGKTVRLTFGAQPTKEVVAAAKHLAKTITTLLIEK